MRLVEEITRETIEPERFAGRCTEPGCSEPSKAGENPHYLRGWFTRHVRETGHRVVIEETA